MGAHNALHHTDEAEEGSDITAKLCTAFKLEALSYLASMDGMSMSHVRDLYANNLGEDP
jgi:hypothetical protein